MLRNYITIGWRNFIKHKTFSLINILGLSIGIAFTMLAAAYVWGEYQVNRSLKNADNQYIIQSRWKDPNLGIEVTSIAQLPKTLKQTYPGLVANYYHWDAISSNVSKGDLHFRESIQIGDSTLLNMYGFKLVAGNPKTVFANPFLVVITTEMAIKYFGKTNVVGQNINIESFSGTSHDFTVSGVLGEIPENTVTSVNGYQSNFFTPAASAAYFGRNLDGWTNVYMVSYIELQKGVNPNDLIKPMQHFIKENASSQISQNLTPYLVSLKTFYLETNGGVVMKMLYTVSFISLFILLMAVINFVNICIGRSSARMKEMGVRKVLGGLKKQLVWQFLVESTLLVMMATLIAFVIYLVARPYFSDILGKQVTGLFSFPLYFYALPFLFALAVGLLAGFYPAMILSALKSVDSLKRKLGSVKESVLFRKSLVTFQFTTAAVVFIGAILISQQVELFFSENAGFDKDYVLYAQVPRDWSAKGVQQMESNRFRLAQNPELSNVSLSYEIPDGANGGAGPQLYRANADPKTAVSTQQLTTDNQYAATYKIRVKAGSFFTPAYTPGDSAQIVINETASKALGWQNPKDAIGQFVKAQGINTLFTICGVTGDFHFGSMQQHIEPTAFINVNYTTNYRYLSFRLKPGDVQKSIAVLQRQWNATLPGAPFEYHFMDEALQHLYQTEIQLKKASVLATVIAIVIVMMGVLGLISLSVQKRTKEMGIRKVLGSSVPEIVTLFVKEFLGVVFIAALISCPLAYFIMHSWLNGYAYRISISLYPFALTLILLTVLTILLITAQTIKTALRSPVKSLRVD